jgi:HAD superfamily hydrolase (TIGR01509 family)
MKKKLVIFDMDGLLLDSERVTDLSWERTFRENNIEFSIEDRHHLIGMGFDEVQVLFAKRFNNENAFWELRKYRENIFFEHLELHGIDIKKGIIELLDVLKRKNIKVAVASSTLQERGEFLLKKTNIHDLFDYHIYGDMVKQTKPNPEIFLRVVNHFNVNKEEALVLEDSFYGVKAANNAEIDVIWVKDLVDIDTKGKVSYINKFNSMAEAIETIESIT